MNEIKQTFNFQLVGTAEETEGTPLVKANVDGQQEILPEHFETTLPEEKGRPTYGTMDIVNLVSVIF